MPELLPWHNKPWQGLAAQITSRHLPHALLLDGPRGSGKERLARRIAQSLLCSSMEATELPCRQCRNCQLFMAGTHPDFIKLSPPPDKSVITIDQIRLATEFLYLTTQSATAKVVIIDPADAMNINAANSLLKTLEEPTAGSFLLLVTSQRTLLPATVRSRCQRLSLPTPPFDMAVKWLSSRLETDIDADLLLRIADGAPLTALDLAGSDMIGVRQGMFGDLEGLVSQGADPLAIAANWLKLGIKESLYWLYSWIVDMIRLKSAANPPLLGNPDLQQRLAGLAQRCSMNHLFRLQDRVSEGMQRLDTSANQQLLLEELLIYWKSVLTK